MKLTLLALLAFFPVSAMAADRGSSVALSLSSGSAAYRGASVDGRFGLGETWSLLAGLASSRSGSEGVSRDLTFGADARWGAFALRLKGTGGSEPNEVSYFGAQLGAGFDFASLWNGELGTVLDLSFGRNRYKQSSSSTDRTLGNQAFVQKQVRVSLTQDLAETLSVSAGFARYTYDQPGSLINRSVNTRRASSGSVDSYIAGFPAQSAFLAIDWQFAEGWSVSPHAGSSKSVLDGAKTTNAGLGISWDFSPVWTIGVDFTRSRPDREAKTSVVSLDLAYRW